MSSSGKPKKPGPVDAILQDAWASARPAYRAGRGAALGFMNDVFLAVGSDRRVEEPPRQQWLRVIRRSAHVLDRLPPATGPRVMFASSYGLSAQMTVVESILAVALRLRGARPVILRCDKSLPACEYNPLGNFAPDPGEFGPAFTARRAIERCRLCSQNMADAYGPLPVEITSFSDFARPDDLARAEAEVDALPYEAYGQHVHAGVRVGEHAYSSTMRATLRGTLLDDAATRFTYRRFLVSAILAVELTERAFAARRPDRVVAFQGVYLTHGTITDVARKHGIHVVVHGLPYRKGTVLLSHDDTYHRTLVSEPTERWQELEMTPRRAAAIDEYLASRQSGSRDYVAYNTEAIEGREEMLRELRLDPAKPIVSLFTNVLWDAQLYYNYTAFSNMIEWLFETIRYFARRPELQLVIRVHPAEVQSMLATRQPIADEIAREFPELPPNVRVIPPSSRLSSYTLAEISKASLIYGTKMGLEIAARGTPLIIAGETFNRGKGYSYDAESREQYFGLLDRVTELPRNSPQMVERAKKYAYHLFYRLMIDFPLFSVTSSFKLTEPRLNFETLDALLPGRLPQLDLICQGIIDGTTPFIYDSLEPEAGAATAAVLASRASS